MGSWLPEADHRDWATIRSWMPAALELSSIEYNVPIEPL